MFLAASIFLLALGAIFADESGIWLMLFSQAALLLGEIRKGQVSGTGGFLFMSFLFFGMRPLYIVLEDDYSLLYGLFRISAEFSDIHANMVIGTASLIVFVLGSKAAQGAGRGLFRRREARLSGQIVTVSPRFAQIVLFYQVATLPVMQYLATGGRALYGSALGAFAYDLPTVMQAGHVFGFVVILERYLQDRRSSDRILVVIAGVLFLSFTWLMREVSMFRGFYIAGVMTVGIAAIQRIKPKVSYLWLILPVILLQPIFQWLGANRYAANEEIKERDVMEEVFGDETLLESYWSFYDGKGDINIFDTFVAARASEPQFRPYVWSWIYAPLHIIPRAFWSGKPERGITQDVAFMNGAPYAPGIAGFFWLDGGSDLWMLACMFVLGAILGYTDGFVLSMRDSYLKACLIAILTINAMFLSRFFLWQAFWQIMYFVVPCLILQHFFAPKRAIVLEKDEDEEDDEGDEPAWSSNHRVPGNSVGSLENDSRFLT